MFNHVTADGCFSAPDGNLDWAVPDDELAESVMEHGPRFDTVLLGRKTYDLNESPKVSSPGRSSGSSGRTPASSPSWTRARWRR
jgi:dihydrofolate reductase